MATTAKPAITSIAGRKEGRRSKSASNDKENHGPSLTVKLDVGGTVYKVSRSLIESFPGTMPAKLVSKRWTTRADDDTMIFIDRNGDRFQYVLDYMRDNEVHLPLSVPKAAIVKDLEFLGFTNIDTNSIHDGAASAEAATQIAKCEALYQKELELCHRTVQRFQKKITYLNIAHACFLSYSKCGHLLSTEFYLGDYSLNLMTLKDEINSAFDNFDRTLFDECLIIHGLKYVSHRPIELRTPHAIWYNLSLTAVQSTGIDHPNHHVLSHCVSTAEPGSDFRK
ncbi:POZ domain-containing protein KCTD8 [Seminavis robusta]|uniref:POZ domain-containing protein KCTD8 n=1 Tax=Seminavis robusta TaxID=568900 RepID=A0A9N8D7Q9_9STRA|nr:POZ domain-containing protein KCTD8 [Seminavis robusta]|eukprot:Sro9_g007360.1 POZ domain-containing protein KCTD8 (281) ;mRNA; f:124912-125754